MPAPADRLGPDAPLAGDRLRRARPLLLALQSCVAEATSARSGALSARTSVASPAPIKAAPAAHRSPGTSPKSAPASARRSPRTGVGWPGSALGLVSPQAINAEPATASPIPDHEARPARSPRNPEERSAANTGAVATRTTEDAMLVIASDVI